MFSTNGLALKEVWKHWLAGARDGPVVPDVSERRSIAKAITYRIFVVIADFVAIYLMTGALKVAVGFTVISNVYTTVIYYLHERAWTHSRWGLNKKALNVNRGKPPPQASIHSEPPAACT